MRREIEKHVLQDLKRKIVLLSGPRQVGKTTLSRQLIKEHEYLNYDSVKDRQLIVSQEWDRDAKFVVFDELHKMKKWKSWIKGIYDTEGIHPSLMITGSARMDAYRKGGDSLAGRYFYYRLHPISLHELINTMDPQDALIRLMEVGGFPKPFLNGEVDFAKRWRRAHLDTILRNDLIDIERVRDIKSIELMIELLRERVGSLVSYASLARDLQVSLHTVKKWLQVLENLYIIFPVRPFHKNVARSLLKESKYYFYDTGAVKNGKGARLENTVACCLMRELHFHEDLTGSKVSLNFLRDKEKREVDFLTVVDGKPLQMIEVKYSDQNFDGNIFHFLKFFKNVTAYQLLCNLERKKMKSGIRLMSASEFLKNLNYQKI